MIFHKLIFRPKPLGYCILPVKLMPRPTAPMITAEYHNYSEHSQFNDYYGGYEPRANGNGTVARQETVPMRIELVDKDEERCNTTKVNKLLILKWQF